MVKQAVILIRNRRELIHILRQTATELNKLENDVRISKVAGGVGGAVGGGMMIGGFIASFFTFGASLIVSAVGAAVAGGGAITGVGAGIAKTVISNQTRGVINGLLQRDADHLRNIRDCIQLAIDSGRLTVSTISNLSGVIRSALQLARAADAIADASRTAFGVLRGATRGLAVAGVVFSVITLPLDVYAITINSVGIHQGREHEDAAELIRIANEIEESLPALEELLNGADI
ncbi:hypothetical protein SNE40_003813 [Patella caerulea]|uniref:Uncharacterized protein n=1 Tax=Patella caerulea TaxID=87958 RepID=A0AAN8KC82_PATCE